MIEITNENGNEQQIAIPAEAAAEASPEDVRTLEGLMARNPGLVMAAGMTLAGLSGALVTGLFLRYQARKRDELVQLSERASALKDIAELRPKAAAKGLLSGLPGVGAKARLARAEARLATADARLKEIREGRSSVLAEAAKEDPALRRELEDDALRVLQIPIPPDAASRAAFFVVLRGLGEVVKADPAMDQVASMFSKAVGVPEAEVHAAVAGMFPNGAPGLVAQAQAPAAPATQAPVANGAVKAPEAPAPSAPGGITEKGGAQ